MMYRCFFVLSEENEKGRKLLQNDLFSAVLTGDGIGRDILLVDVLTFDVTSLIIYEYELRAPE
jgi:hypothetical protein